MHADWCLLLARTDPDAPKRKGISYFLMDMTTPGVDVRPIRNAIGDSHFCEVFLNDVTIPAANLVGDENAGWQVAQATLGAERGMTMLELAERLGNAGFQWLLQSSPVEDPIVADRLAQFETEITGLRGLCRKVVEDNEAGTGRPRRRLHRQAVLQRTAAADDGFRRGDRGTGRAHRAGQAHVQWLGVGRLAARLHRVVGVDDPRRRQRDPAHHHRRARAGPAAGTERRLMAHEFTSEFHDELRSVAGDLLAKDRAVDWPVLVDAGWVGLEVPDQFGGAGATFAETAVVCEEMGRAASATSYLGGAVLAVGVLKALQPSDTRDRLLADVASGAVRLAVALESTDFVPDAEGADRILVVADGGVVDGRRDRHPSTRGGRNAPTGDRDDGRRRGRGGAAVRR